METDPAVKYARHQQERYDYVSALVHQWEQRGVPPETALDTIDTVIASETQRYKEALYECRTVKRARFRRVVKSTYERMLRMLNGARALIVHKRSKMKVHS